MSVNYSLSRQSSKPGQADAPPKWYARMQTSGEVTMDEMAEEISYASSLTDGDVLNALRALVRQLNKHLANGKIVRMENFGSFQLQLHSTGTDSEESFTEDNILHTSIQFRPSRVVKAATRAGQGGLTFKRVTKLTDKPTSGSDTDDDHGGSGEDPLPGA